MELRSKSKIQEIRSSINDLPNELLLHIFSYLPIVDIKCHISRVSVKWSALSKDSGLWKNIYYSTSARKRMLNEDNAWLTVKKFLKTTPQLQHIIITPSRTTEEIRTILLILMKYCVNLRGIEFNTDWHHFSDIFLLLPTYLKSIEYLKISLNPEYGNSDLLKLLKDFKLLNSVEFLYKNPKANEFEIFSCHSPFLQHLNISNDSISVNEFLFLLKKKDNLLSLWINVSDLSPDCIKSLSDFSKLKVLKIVDKNSDFNKLKEIGKLKNLKELHLQEDPKSAVLTSSTLNDFFRLGQFPQLQDLKLHKIRLDDEGVVEIRRNCPNLRNLDVITHPYSTERLTDASLLHLFHCQKLESIEIIFKGSSTNDWVFRRSRYVYHKCEIDEDCSLGLDGLFINWDEVEIPID